MSQKLSAEMADKLDKIVLEEMYKPLIKCWFGCVDKVWKATIELKASKDANPVKENPEQNRELAHREPWNAIENAMDDLMTAYNDNEGRMMKFYQLWKENLQQVNEMAGKKLNAAAASNHLQEMDDENYVRVRGGPLDGIVHKVLWEPFEIGWMAFKAAMEEVDEDDQGDVIQQVDEADAADIDGEHLDGQVHQLLWEPLEQSWAEFKAAMEEEENAEEQSGPSAE